MKIKTIHHYGGSSPFSHKEDKRAILLEICSEQKSIRVATFAENGLFFEENEMRKSDFKRLFKIFQVTDANGNFQSTEQR